MAHIISDGILLDEKAQFSLSELSCSCSVSAEWIIELVNEGVLDPVGQKQVQWRFSGRNLQKAMTATRLQRDLGVNRAGIALALDLLDEIEELRSELSRLDSDF